MSTKTLAREWVSVREAAALVGASEQVIYRAIYAGRLPAYKVSGRLRITRAEVARIVTATAEVPGR